MVQPGWSSKCFFSCFYKSMRNTPVCLKTENTRLSFMWSPLRVGSIWLIQVSIVTLLVGRPCHLSHTSHIKRGQNQNKLKHTKIVNCAGKYPMDLADVFLLKELYHFAICIFRNKKSSLHPKKLVELIFKDVGKVKNLGITWNLEVLEACSMLISDVGFIGNTH